MRHPERPALAYLAFTLLLLIVSITLVVVRAMQPAPRADVPAAIVAGELGHAGDGGYETVFAREVGCAQVEALRTRLAILEQRAEQDAEYYRALAREHLVPITFHVEVKP
jgi:hypothetical protein